MTCLTFTNYRKWRSWCTIKLSKYVDHKTEFWIRIMAEFSGHLTIDNYNIVVFADQTETGCQ